MVDTKDTEGPIGTVSRKILVAVFDHMATEDKLADVAPRLRKVVLEDGLMSDAALRAAMFADEL